MSDLRDLYQEVIVDHSRNPRNFYKIDLCANMANGINPLLRRSLNVVSSF